MTIISQDHVDIPLLVGELKAGKTMVYPTETCYGLGCDATNKEAVDAVFRIKKRQTNKSVLMLVPSIAMAMDYVIWSNDIERIAQTYWPGTLTMVARAEPNCGLPSGVLAEDDTLAVRVTNHPFVVTLCNEFGKPLVSTSANIVSQESPYDIDAVKKMFEGQHEQPDIVIDAGVLIHHAPSTIIKIIDGDIQVLRQGEVIVRV